jgi:hypothetical protein
LLAGTIVHRACNLYKWGFSDFFDQSRAHTALVLGLDIEVLGFDTARRADLIAMPESLVAHVANTLEVSRREKRFAHALIESGQDVSRKMLDAP